MAHDSTSERDSATAHIAAGSIEPYSQASRIPLQLSYCPHCKRANLPLRRFDLRFNTLEDLMDCWGITISDKAFNSGTQKWRLTYPNQGELDGFPHFGEVFIVATNGMLAYYYTGNPDELFLGHLRAFNGPIAKEFIHPNDWDFKNRKRVVTVRKKFEGKNLRYITIPHDTPKDEYWSKHPRMSKEEIHLYADLLHFNDKGELCKGTLRFDEFDTSLEALNTRNATEGKEPKKREKSRVQKALDLL